MMSSDILVYVHTQLKTNSDMFGFYITNGPKIVRSELPENSGISGSNAGSIIDQTELGSRRKRETVGHELLLIVRYSLYQLHGQKT